MARVSLKIFIYLFYSFFFFLGGGGGKGKGGLASVSEFVTNNPKLYRSQ